MEDLFIKSLMAEFVGTFILILFATFVLIMCASQGFGTVGSLLLGLVLMGCIYMFGKWSGAHFNPAVSLSFWVAGRMDFPRMLMFIGLQITAALAAVGLAFWFYGTDVTEVFTDDKFGEDSWKKVAFCSLLVGFLCLAYLLMYEDKNNIFVSGLVIGGIFAIVSSLSKSTNFAAVFASSVIEDDWDTLWIYVCACALAALGAGLIVRCFGARLDASYVTDPATGDVMKDAHGRPKMVSTSAKRTASGSVVKDNACGSVETVTEHFSKPNPGYHQVGLSSATNRYSSFTDDLSASFVVARSATAGKRSSPKRMGSPSRAPSRSGSQTTTNF